MAVMEIRIEDYLTEEEIKEIVRREITEKARAAIEENDLDRIISNSGYRIIFKAIDEQINEDLTELIRKKAVEVISKLGTWEVFRAKSLWVDANSRAYVCLQEAVEQNKDILVDRIRELMICIDRKDLLAMVNDMIYENIENRLTRK